MVMPNPMMQQQMDPTQSPWLKMAVQQAQNAPPVMPQQAEMPMLAGATPQEVGGDNAMWSLISKVFPSVKPSPSPTTPPASNSLSERAKQYHSGFNSAARNGGFSVFKNAEERSKK